MTWLGEYPEDYATVVCMFTTHDGNGAPVAPSTAFEAADVLIYKNGSATQKTTTNGVTMTSPFDAITGLHAVVIDTSNDTGDTGFWTTGGGDVFTLVLSPDETVNSQAVAKVIGQFGIELSRALRPTTAGRKIDVDANGGIEVGSFQTGAITATAFTAGAIDAAAIAADAIGSSELAASAVTEIQAGLSTLDAAGVRSAVGLASANLDTQLTTIDDFLDTEIAAIKAKTDSLTFTVANQVDANIQSVNDVTVTGTGAAGSTWGP